MISCYGNLRAEAISLTAAEIYRIRTPLDQRTSTSFTYSLRACDVSNILLLCNFCPGLMIRCLGGVYTSKFLDFSSIDACLIALSDIPFDPGKPLMNSPRCNTCSTSTYASKLHSGALEWDIISRKHYNNHLAPDPYLSSIKDKPATDTQKSYSIVLPHWTLSFSAEFFLHP